MSAASGEALSEAKLFGVESDPIAGVRPLEHPRICPLPASSRNTTTVTERESTEPTEDLVEVVPLNDEQRQAVVSAFEQPLTVVTGPPGTGKSQVIVSILANAYLRGQRVLFTSRNNKLWTSWRPGSTRSANIP